MPPFLQPTSTSSFKRKHPGDVSDADQQAASRKRISLTTSQLQGGTSRNGLNAVAQPEQIWMVQW